MNSPVSMRLGERTRREHGFSWRPETKEWVGVGSSNVGE